VAFWPILISGRLEHGRLELDRGRLAALLRGAPDSEVSITIEKLSATRSIQQNAYYWGVLLATIAAETGQPAADLHEFCKAKFNGRPVVVLDRAGTIAGEQWIAGSTTQLNRIEFGEYMDQIQAWAGAELGIVIPDPDPAWRDPAWREAEVARGHV